MSVTGAGERASRRPGVQRPHPLVNLVWRLVVAQAVATVAVGLPFSRRHLPSVLITLSLFVAMCLVAVVARGGTRTAWLALVSFETVFFLFGLARFVSARYLGGTLFALVIAGTLVHPAVARAYTVMPGRLAGADEGEMGLGDAAGEPLREQAAG